eukprot:CAMPEP_0119374714 /NCGR_PEP_ID=MMETSP1334-20130426/32357_1 /TAXON_ID=127549 /ORGANISM="Calcidiscus leptoporus, Strain RCC1130" /LENGTH=91 /DNA_ID=CAMNT_0007392845 /DNA_START=29 /DNA_END=304 /DNA_ORIENTATION=+
MLKTIITFAMFAAAEAFTVLAGARPMVPMRTTTQQAVLAPEAVGEMVAGAVPTTMAIADSGLTLAAGGLAFLFIPLSVVAVVIINFGIMKK